MKKESITKVLGAILLVLLLVVCMVPEEHYEAATSYTNAREFYESTYSVKDDAHAEAANACFYFATYAKKASSGSNLKYRTIGFDISLSANGYTVSFATKVGVSMKEVEDSRVDTGTHLYILYCVERDFLYEMGGRADAAAMEQIKKANKITVRVDAIMTLVKGNSPYGSIEEDGRGGIVESNPQHIYHLKEEADLNAMKRIFSGHEFKSDQKIERDLYNYVLTLYYKTDADVKLADGYKVSGGYIQLNGSVYKDTCNIMQNLTLLDTDVLTPRKTGYHLPKGEEWKTASGRTFSDSIYYAPTDIEPAVGFGNKTATLSLNWKPNTYTVSYDAAGGIGTVIPSTFHYDNDKAEYLAANTFTRSGYYLPKGAEWVDVYGKTYASEEKVHNLTSEQGKILVLYANWKPLAFEIQLDKDGGTGGSDFFFEQYGEYFYGSNEDKTPISSISIPWKQGHTFLGYYMGYFGTGLKAVDAEGCLPEDTRFFTGNTVLHAAWEAKAYVVTFDKQGGTGGSDEASVTYGATYPENVSAPEKPGYSFRGYYTEPEGKGAMVYTENMAPIGEHKADADIVLYACWKDDVPPETNIVANSLWTNSPVTLTAGIRDFGSGLKLYEFYKNGNLFESNSSLSGRDSLSRAIVHREEGIFTFRLMAKDMEDNSSEAYATIKIDMTAPRFEEPVYDDSLTVENLSNFSISIRVSDYKVEP